MSETVALSPGDTARDTARDTGRESPETPSWEPRADDFINLKGKMYLPARRRVQWLRAVHEDWTIDTTVEQMERGVRSSSGLLAGGYALIRANLYTEEGRLISTGLKSEYSENFPDYVEKAETGAIARCLAVAGFGTENALDLDEGLEKERIADAPVEPPAIPTITSSAAKSVGKGGSPVSVTYAQVQRISALSTKRALGPIGLGSIVEGILGISIELTGSEEDMRKQLGAQLNKLNAEEAGLIIQALESLR